ncbi:MAG: hypothetical protein ACXWZG_05550 [Microbacterium sp.]
MTEANLPHKKHADDAVADDAAPTDAVTDEVREASARAESTGPGDVEERPLSSP